MTTIDTLVPWKSWRKIVFRFLVLFIGFFLLNYEIVFIAFKFDFYDSLAKIYSSLGQPLLWLDKHLYHTGYDPQRHQSPPGDNHYGIVFYYTVILVIILVVIIWSFLDRHKTQYHKLNYWFRLYVRYMVALIMFGYGIDKLIPVQMSYPGIADLLTPVGEQNRFSTLWNFVGASRGYEIFTGSCEVAGSLLLLFRRTYIFGCLVTCTILCNVVALNMFYNIPVKLYSSLLFISVLFLLIPFIHKLVLFFFYGQAVSLDEKHYRFEKSWRRWLVIALGILLPVFGFLTDTIHVYDRYREQGNILKREKLYEVTYFTAKDTLPPLLTDTLRWKRFAFAYRNSAIIYSMQDNALYFDYDMDTVKHTCTLHDNPDTASWHVFHYSYPQKDILQLTGNWKGQNVAVTMKEVSTDNMSLNKERITFLQD